MTSQAGENLYEVHWKIRVSPVFSKFLRIYEPPHSSKIINKSRIKLKFEFLKKYQNSLLKTKKATFLPCTPMCFVLQVMSLAIPITRRPLPTFRKCSIQRT